MNLPYDYARCPGTDDPQCQSCARRQPGHPERQSYIAPPPPEQWHGCENYIEDNDAKAK